MFLDYIIWEQNSPTMELKKAIIAFHIHYNKMQSVKQKYSKVSEINGTV